MTMRTHKVVLIAILGMLALLLAPLAHAQQNTLTATTLGAAQNDTATTLRVASATNITVQIGTTFTELYIDQELEVVLSVNGVQVGVSRGQAGTRAGAHLSGATVLVGRPTWFQFSDPTAGACTPANIVATPWVNIITGMKWQCSTVLLRWVPGFGNPGTSAIPGGVSTAVASAAGLVTPTGPLFHITGALAITGFNIPVGFDGPGFCVIPDGNFTTTTANNIALASTAVTSKTLCFTYDKNAAKPFFPSY